MAIDPAVITSARSKATGYVIAKQAQELWAATQRDIIATREKIRASIAAADPPAVTALYARQQGAALYASADRATALLADITAALAAWGGFTADEVSQSHEYMLAACAALRDTPADGSQASALLASLDAQFAPATVIW